MKKTYITPNIKVRQINIKHNLLLGSDTQNVGTETNTENPADAGSSLSKEGNGFDWGNTPDEEE